MKAYYKIIRLKFMRFTTTDEIISDLATAPLLAPVVNAPSAHLLLLCNKKATICLPKNNKKSYPCALCVCDATYHSTYINVLKRQSNESSGQVRSQVSERDNDEDK